MESLNYQYFLLIALLFSVLVMFSTDLRLLQNFHWGSFHWRFRLGRSQRYLGFDGFLFFYLIGKCVCISLWEQLIPCYIYDGQLRLHKYQDLLVRIFSILNLWHTEHLYFKAPSISVLFVSAIHSWFLVSFIH